MPSATPAARPTIQFGVVFFAFFVMVRSCRRCGVRGRCRNHEREMTEVMMSARQRPRQASCDVVHASEGWAVLAVCASLFLVGIDLTVLNVALPSLTEELMPGATEVSWIVDVYSLTVAALLVTCGTLGDRLGRKQMVPAGFAVFGVASAAAAHSAGATVGPVLGGALVVGRGLPGQRAPRGLRADRRRPADPRVQGPRATPVESGGRGAVHRRPRAGGLRREAGGRPPVRRDGAGRGHRRGAAPGWVHSPPSGAGARSAGRGERGGCGRGALAGRALGVPVRRGGVAPVPRRCSG
ncbi:MFS transporter [Nonomuraea sp. NPDC047529]|uniref:MFS transporter n=1 Tax=Nonomuraea sp. NPDC047529 TaxID=3155623 RepID=UPI0033C665B9